jgi:hypothetical protein
MAYSPKCLEEWNSRKLVLWLTRSLRIHRRFIAPWFTPEAQCDSSVGGVYGDEAERVGGTHRAAGVGAGADGKRRLFRSAANYY